MSYGVQDSGFILKPLPTILSEIEEEVESVFGSSIIQTPESPMGQINGIFSNATAELWELAEDVYQSMDPDQAEARRLEIIGRLRILQRNGLDDIALRREINNKDVTKFNLKDVEQSLLNVEGIRFIQGFLNDDGSLTPEGLALGDVALAIIGGDDTLIANELIKTLPIGGNTFGNTVVSSDASTGVSQDFNILRITEVDVALELDLRLNNDTFDLFQPDIQQIIEGFVQEWADDRINGRDVDSFTIRRLIECRFPNIELVNFTATLGANPQQAENVTATVGFDEIAKIVADGVTASFI